jgi:hypothetical protein
MRITIQALVDREDGKPSTIVALCAIDKTSAACLSRGWAWSFGKPMTCFNSCDL